jgi:hypothetical protein
MPGASPVAPRHGPEVRQAIGEEVRTRKQPSKKRQESSARKVAFDRTHHTQWRSECPRSRARGWWRNGRAAARPCNAHAPGPPTSCSPRQGSRSVQFRKSSGSSPRCIRADGSDPPPLLSPPPPSSRRHLQTAMVQAPRRRGPACCPPDAPRPVCRRLPRTHPVTRAPRTLSGGTGPMMSTSRRTACRRSHTPPPSES